MTPEECAIFVQKCRPRVAVVGDYMLDGWWSGSAHRVAREAPAPIVEIGNRKASPGGAGNAALNVAMLGGRSNAVGIIGDDATAIELSTQLEAAGVDTELLRQMAGEHTTSKVRVSVDNHVVVRLDDVNPAVSEAVSVAFTEAIKTALAECDALLVCDYGGALIVDAVLSALGESTRPPLVVVDARDPGRWRELAPDVSTPNAAEAERITGVTLGSGEARAAAAVTHAEGLLAATGAHSVIVTLDESGTILLRPESEPHRTHAAPALERHASGAGDVFAAAFTLASAAGIAAESAADFAQRAADIAVRSEGTCVCATADLISTSTEQTR